MREEAKGMKEERQREKDRQREGDKDRATQQNTFIICIAKESYMEALKDADPVSTSIPADIAQNVMISRGADW